MFDPNRQPFVIEITIVSAEGLKNTSTFFSKRIRPFITLTTAPPTPYKPTGADKQSQVYMTRVDDEGGINPTWGDKFRLPMEATFFSHRYSAIYLHIYTKRLMKSKIQLGWCQIPAGDILEGFSPAGTLRHLSYRLRDRDGTRGHGIVNVAVRLEGSFPVFQQRPADPGHTQLPAVDPSQMAIGIPVTLFPGSVVPLGGGCRGGKRPTSGREGREVGNDVIEQNQWFECRL